MASMLDRYLEVAPPGTVENLRRLAEPLKGMSFLRVNSTRQGGGVAEMLHQFMPMMEDLGLKPRWDVIEGHADFYAVTKAFHNALQGNETVLSDAMKKTYVDTVKANAKKLDMGADAVVIDDPQPAALVEKRKKKVPWVWRCHIDVSRPDRSFWNFLGAYVEKYDAAIFSLPKFGRRLPIPQIMISPCIDPLSDKNRSLSPAEVASTLAKLGIEPHRPIILQVSRFDHFKDPVGVIKAFKIVRRRMECLLVLAGGSADDDPEGAAVLEEVRQAAGDDPDIRILLLPPTAHLEINALQRAATVILQKSTKEGFGLTVTEAMWKGKPVIGGHAGGIATQIIHGVTGYLVNSVEGAAYRIQTLLEDPEKAYRMGEEGRERVRRNFLMTRNVMDYLVLLRWLKERS